MKEEVHLIYEKIIRLCKERKVSIAKLEKEAGIGNGTIRHWVNASPRISSVQAVADYFGIAITDLLDSSTE